MKFEKIQSLQNFKIFDKQLQRDGFGKTLVRILKSAYNKHQKPIGLFFRDDDIDVLTFNLIRLLKIFLEHKVTLHLQIIPKNIKPDTVACLKGLKKQHPELVFLSQHGWSHQNHSRNGKKYEFGNERTQTEQFLDIASGKDRMAELFLNDFFLAFTPPWNRYDPNTSRALKELGFEVISADGGKIGVTDSGLFEISTAIDCYHRRPTPVMKSSAHLLFELSEGLQKQPIIGLLLHHEEMHPGDYKFLENFLSILKIYGAIELPNFREIYSKFSRPENAVEN